MRDRIYHQVTKFVAGLTDIASGLASAFTLGFWQPNLTFRWVRHRTIMMHMRKSAELNPKQKA